MNWFGLLRLGFLLISVSAQNILFEGDECETENQIGRCVRIDECNYAKNLLKIGQRPTHCGFKNRIPIVCCPITSEKLSNLVDIGFGNKSSEACKKYFPQYGPQGGYFSGKYTAPHEFPHMAVLGYGEKNSTHWLCGGTLISEYFVLTAAHCLHSQDLGQVNTVRLGELDFKVPTDGVYPENYGIAEIFPHPNFNPPSHYNDIALLKLDRPVKRNSNVKPACLYTDYYVSNSTLIGTGWGQTDFLGESSSHLLKVDLDYVPYETCAVSYANVSPQKLQNGIIDEIQICAGGEDGRDACPGDSGGPLQFKSPDTKQIAFHFSIVGITSFGKACGVENSIGVYTRVAPYTPWIENIVWP